MWQQTHSFCLILSVIVNGSVSFVWNMSVSPVVFVPRGEDAVLGCSFTHPYQQHYSGKIAVKWLAREARAPPFFSCSVNNDSMEGRVGCSDSELKYSLEGDPRRGELSLLFRKVHLGDNGTYFCRVELEGAWQNIQKKTQLYVTVKPHILSLSVIEASSGPDGAPRRLQCEAEGHPLPTVTWLPASTSLMGEQVQTSQAGPYRLASSVPYLQDDVFTCRAESRLGAAEQTFPDHNTLKITLTVGGLIVLLLLLSIGFFCYMRNRARVDSPPVYGNADVVENHRLQDSDVELQLVYSTVSVTESTSSQHGRFHSCRGQQEEPGTFYSPVNI